MHLVTWNTVNIITRNIVVEDPRPTMQLFMLLLSNAGMDTCNGHLVSRDPGDVHGIVFQVQLQ